MNTELQQTIETLFPLPASKKLHTHKFGANLESAWFPVPAGAETGDSDPARGAFEIRWEDKDYGLTVLIRERREAGHLIADVFCTDAAQVNKLALSVSLVGGIDNQMIHKTIPLNIVEKTGCAGSADFGPFAKAIEKLGTQMAVIVFMLV